MATEVANLRAYLDADTDQFNRKMNAADRTMSNTSHRGSRAFAALGTAAKAGFLVAGAAVVAGAGYSIKAASDLGESVNAVEVVFGKASKQIYEFGKTSATAAGLSARAFNEAVTPIGAALQNTGLNAKEAADQAINLTQRAADMASVFNVDVSESLGAIQAGLRGELDPLEKFGVSLNEAALQGYAVKTGIAGANEELTAAQKVQARLGLIMEQTNKVQGDFANTSDGLANLTRILRARVEDLAAGFGKVLMPAVLVVVNFLNDTALPALERFEDFVKRIFRARTLRGKLNIVWEGVREAASDLLDKIRDALFGTAAQPLKLDTGKIIELDQRSTQGLIDKLATALNLANWTDIGARVGEGIGRSIKFGAETLNSILTSITVWIDSHSKQIGQLGLKLILSMVDAMSDPDFWRKNWELILSVALTVLPVGKLLKIGGRAAQIIVRAFGREGGVLFVRFLDFVAKLFDRIPTILSKAFRLTIIYTFVNGVEGLIRRMVEFIKEQWDKLPGWAKTIFRTLASLFRIYVISPVEVAIDKIRSFFQWIRNGIDAVSHPLRTLGDLFGGIKDKISDLNPFGDGIVGAGLGAFAGASSISPTLYDDLALGQADGLTLTSGYRPGAVTSTGNPSLHGVYPAKAIDMAGSESAMRSFFLQEVARGALTGLREVIHSPFWWHPGSGISRIPASAGSVLRDHYSHVHVGSYDQGGYLRPGLNVAWNGTGRNEPVGFGGTTNVYVGGSVIAERDLHGLIRRLQGEHWQRGGA